MKIQIIRYCTECKNYIFDDNDVKERWGKHWCDEKDRECDDFETPTWCPLEEV